MNCTDIYASHNFRSTLIVCNDHTNLSLLPYMTSLFASMYGSVELHTLNNDLVDEYLLRVRASDSFIGLCPLEIRLRYFLIGRRLDSHKRKGSPIWSISRSLCRLLFAVKFDPAKLFGVYSDPATKPQFRNYVRILAKLDLRGIIDDSSKNIQAYKDILHYQHDGCKYTKHFDPVKIRLALSFGILGPDFAPENFLYMMTRDTTEHNLIVFVLISIMTHYFPVRGSSIAALKCGDVKSGKFFQDCFVLCVTNNKTRDPFSRGFPAWFGVALHLYILRYRPQPNDSSDFLFVNGESRETIKSEFQTIGCFQLKLFRKYRGLLFSRCQNVPKFVGGNMKRKIHETCMRQEDYNLHGTMEHSKKAGDKHYVLPSSRLLHSGMWKYIHALNDYYRDENLNPPPEWARIACSVPIESLYDLITRFKLSINA